MSEENKELIPTTKKYLPFRFFVSGTGIRNDTNRLQEFHSIVEWDKTDLDSLNEEINKIALVDIKATFRNIHINNIVEIGYPVEDNE
jgi:hypothetical protein